jgi:ribonuclease P protein component
MRQGALKTGTGLFTAVVKPNGLGLNRLGVTATRKVGRAVVRNRLKRLAREFFRLHQAAWPQGLDVLLIARPLGDRDIRSIKGPDERVGRRLAALMGEAVARDASGAGRES